MAGYSLCSLNNNTFSALITSPTLEQGLALANCILDELGDLLEEFENQAEAAKWPTERDPLADLIITRLALPDWYSDLGYDSACLWNNVLYGLQGEAGELIGIDVQYSDYEGLYFDVAEIAAKQGASMMDDPTFGSSGFRYSGKPACELTVWPLYSIFTPKQTQRLLLELEAVEPYFASMPKGDGSPHEQFFEGLLPTVRKAANDRRFLWVDTDT